MCDLCENTFSISNRQRVQLEKSLNINGLVEAAINQLYNDRKVDAKTRKDLMASHYEPLKQAVNEGYGRSLITVEYGTPNYEFLKALQTNTAVFAAFKNHAAIKEITGLLKGDDGNLRTKEDFKREALKIDSKYRVDHLSTEYDTAVRQARMAANWQQYEKKKKLYPMLRYTRSKAAKPDEAHLKYVGINRPIDDPFWSANYPPNRFRCQCGVEPNDDDATDIPANLPPPADGFAFNSGKTQQVFDLDNSAYIKSVPASQQPALIRDAKKMVNLQAAGEIEYQPMYKSKAGHTVEAHPLAFDNNDFDAVLKTARELANLKNGPKKIEVLPDVYNYQLRQKLLPDVSGNYNPDYRLDGKLFDLKSPSGKEPGTRTLKNLMGKAFKQAGNGVIEIPDNYNVSELDLYNGIGFDYRRPEFADFKLWLKYKGEWKFYTQQTFLEYKKGLK